MKGGEHIVEKGIEVGGAMRGIIPKGGLAPLPGGDPTGGYTYLFIQLAQVSGLMNLNNRCHACCRDLADWGRGGFWDNYQRHGENPNNDKPCHGEKVLGETGNPVNKKSKLDNAAGEAAASIDCYRDEEGNIWAATGREDGSYVLCRCGEPQAFAWNKKLRGSPAAYSAGAAANRLGRLEFLVPSK